MVYANVKSVEQLFNVAFCCVPPWCLARHVKGDRGQENHSLYMSYRGLENHIMQKSDRG
jgi:hypothetical protein